MIQHATLRCRYLLFACVFTGPAASEPGLEHLQRLRSRISNSAHVMLQTDWEGSAAASGAAGGGGGGADGGEGDAAAAGDGQTHLGRPIIDTPVINNT